MKKFVFTSLCLCATLLLSGCGDRPGWDKKLASACGAAVKVMLKDNEEIRIDKTSFSVETSAENEKLRVVALEAGLSRNKRQYVPQTYTCYFNEEIGPFGLGWRPSLYRLEMNKNVYGNKDGAIVGDFNDFMKLTTAVNNAI